MHIHPCHEACCAALNSPSGSNNHRLPHFLKAACFLQLSINQYMRFCNILFVPKSAHISNTTCANAKLVNNTALNEFFVTDTGRGCYHFSGNHIKQIIIGIFSAKTADLLQMADIMDDFFAGYFRCGPKH